MTKSGYHNFGIVDDKGDFFEFIWDSEDTGECRLESIVQTERGPWRIMLATVPTTTWKTISDRAIRELVTGMDEAERTKKAPTLNIGINRMSPLMGREIAVLLWALMEAGAEKSLEAILHGWRELAREERWWLFSKASVSGQRTGIGWRRAIFHALSEAPESRHAPSPKEIGDVSTLLKKPALASDTKGRKKKRKNESESKQKQLTLFEKRSL
jgi:hypothetical protein